jgi:hypothetical protein
MSRVLPTLGLPFPRSASSSHSTPSTTTTSSSLSSLSAATRPALSTLQDIPAPHPTDLRSRPHSPRSHPMRRSNSPHGRSSFVGTVHSHDSFQPRPTVSSRIRLFATQTFSLFISSFFLTFVVIWAFFHRLRKQVPAWIRREQPKVHSWDRREHRKKERVVNDVGYYARQVGFDIVDEEVETADGYLLR